MKLSILFQLFLLTVRRRTSRHCCGAHRPHSLLFLTTTTTPPPVRTMHRATPSSMPAASSHPHRSRRQSVYPPLTSPRGPAHPRPPCRRVSRDQLLKCLEVARPPASLSLWTSLTRFAPDPRPCPCPAPTIASAIAKQLTSTPLQAQTGQQLASRTEQTTPPQQRVRRTPP